MILGGLASANTRDQAASDLEALPLQFGQYIELGALKDTFHFVEGSPLLAGVHRRSLGFDTALTQPKLVLNPGLVNVEISNRTKNTITCQLLIHVAEPCRIIKEEERVRSWETGLSGLAGIGRLR